MQRPLQGSGGNVSPAGSEGLSGVFDKHAIAGSSGLGESCPVGALAVEMHRKDCAGGRVFLECRGCCGRVEIAGARIDIRQHRGGAQPQDGAGGREEGERGGQDLVARLNAGCGEGQPERVRARPASDSVRYSAVPGGGLLELGHLGTEDEALAAEDRLDCCHHLGRDLGIFPREIEQGNGGRGQLAGALRRWLGRGNVVLRDHQRSLSQPRAYFLHPTHVSDRSSVR